MLTWEIARYNKNKGMYWMYIWMVKFIKGEINIYSLSENVHCLQYMNVNLRILLRTNWNETFFTSHQRICFVLQCIVVCYRFFTDTLQRNKEEMFMHKMCWWHKSKYEKAKPTQKSSFFMLFEMYLFLHQYSEAAWFMPS